MPRKQVMLTLSQEEYLRLFAAWESSAAEPWRRVPFATWVRRTMLNLCPLKTKPAKRRKVA